MTKRAGPDFRKARRPLRKCSECRGKRLVIGLFYEMLCGSCAGVGFVDRETGAALEGEEAREQLILEIQRLAQIVEDQAKSLAAVRNDRGYGPMGARYHGD